MRWCELFEYDDAVLETEPGQIPTLNQVLKGYKKQKKINDQIADEKAKSKAKVANLLTKKE